MVLTAVNKSKQLLCVSYIGQISVAELEEGRKDLPLLLGDLTIGFCLLADLSRLDFMTEDCAPVLGGMMELCDHKGVGLVVRVIPDPAKDIGLNILSTFHYFRRPRILTCRDMNEAARLLPL